MRLPSRSVEHERWLHERWLQRVWHTALHGGQAGTTSHLLSRLTGSSCVLMPYASTSANAWKRKRICGGGQMVRNTWMQ